ncbi:MAG: hypothetical protein A2X81_10315 [Desulfobacterales bacterium GWB2_56_26]|nr:MAG: hypothetical protein A2X81_10315 [Desulfobacterales bacterium GWB2_56_26]
MNIKPHVFEAIRLFSGRNILFVILAASLLFGGCSSVNDNTAKTLEKQIELQQVRHELTTEPVISEKKTVPELEQMGDTYFRKGDINRAYLYYLKGLNVEPNRISLLQKQGRLLIRKKKYAEAELVYGRLTPLAGDDPQTLAGHSMAYFGQGRFEEAEQGFLAALAKKEDDWQAHEYLGLIHSQKQEYDEAIAQFKTALAYKPRDLSITNNLAVTCYLNGDFAEATRLLENLAARTKDRKIYNNLALAHFQLGHYDIALEYFKKGSDNEAAAYNNMGQEYLFAKKFEKAIEAFDKAIALNPKYYTAAQKNMDQAKRQLASVLAKAEE